MASLDPLLQQLLSVDNNVRSQAEIVYTNARGQPDSLISGLLQSLRQSPEEPIRSIAATLLRPLLTKSSQCVWDSLAPQTKTLVTTQILAAIETEQSHKVRSKICDIIAELGSVVVPLNEWPELLPFMFKCSKSPTDSHRESALSIFSLLAEYLGETFRPYFQLLKDIFSAGLTDQMSFGVRVAALAATANFLQLLNTPEERQPFQELIPAMLNTVKDALQQGKTDEADSALQLLVSVAEVETAFFKPSLPLVLDTMVAIANEMRLEAGTRHLAVEVLLTMAESRPGMIKRQSDYVPRLIQVLLNYMLTIEDDEDWNNKTEEEEETDVTDYEVGQEGVDRIAICIKGKTLVPLLFTAVPTLLSNTHDWKHRFVGLMAVSFATEGCSEALLPNLGHLVQMVTAHAQDPHPRVRFAVCNCLGQMATDFAGDLQGTYAQSVMAAIMSCMGDSDNPRVQAHAASAVVNFCEDCPAETLLPFMDSLLAKLITLLPSNKILVQEQVITAIASVADCAQERFEKYYDSFVPYLKSILVNAVERKEYRKLRGKAIECLSLIGLAVGKARFTSDAREVMEAMMTTRLDNDDPQAPFILNSWARISECLGEDFVPYLGYVMPSLIATASTKTESHVTDLEDDSKEGWDYVEFGNKKVGIHTSTLEEKSDACNMIFCYADNLKEGFFPYVESVSKLMVPLLQFYYHENVRLAAVSILAPLMISAREFLQKSNAARGADKMYVRNLFDYMISPLMEATGAETDTEVLFRMLQEMVECMKIAEEGCLNADKLKEAGSMMKNLLKDYQERKKERSDQRNHHDYVEEDEEDIVEDQKTDEEILQQIADTCGAFFKYSHAEFVPMFMGVGLSGEGADAGQNDGGAFALTLELLKSSIPSERKSALCIFDDMMEYCGQSVLSLYPQFLPLMVEYMQNSNPDVRQAAVYGSGLVAQFAGEQFNSVASMIVPRLTTLVTLPDARNEEFANATENAISAIGKVMEYQPQSVTLAQMLPLWLSFLPVKADKIESKIIYNQLCKFIELHATTLLGPGFTNLPKLLSVFGSAVGTEFVDAEITRRMVAILKGMQGQLPPDVLHNAWAAVDQEGQQRLQNALAQQ